MTITATAYRALATEARTLRAAIKNYSQPMDTELVAWVVANKGQAALDALVAESAAYLTAQRARLAEITPAMEEHEAGQCTRCAGHGVYQGASRYVNSKGQKTCFQCKGTGRRKG